ncbi:Spo0E family sporulation regulatory protein-aspartic acid phosphatase [Clostridium sp. JNZ X4-2]
MSREKIYKLKRELNLLIHQNTNSDKLLEISGKLDEALEEFMYEKLKNTPKYKTVSDK